MCLYLLSHLVGPLKKLFIFIPGFNFSLAGLFFEIGFHSVAQAGQPLSVEITGVSQQAQPGFYFPFETGSCCVAQASLELTV